MPTVQVNGDRLSELRGVKRWTQQQLADRSSLSERTIFNMEANRRVRRNILAAVARELGVLPEDLIAKPEATEQSQNAPRSRRREANPRTAQSALGPTHLRVPDGFEEFWGQNAASASNQGAVIVQSDSIETLLTPFLQNPSAAISASPTARLYKARTWVNRWDIDGAVAIEQEFQKYRINPPKIILDDHRYGDELSPLLPFEVTMGLGFTDRTAWAVGVCQPWMRVSRDSRSGDTVLLHNDLLPVGPLSRFAHVEADPETGFFPLRPAGWNRNYLRDWTLGEDVQDYAMIFRHTYNDRPRQVRFVLAGFTERATAIAGRYLANNWKALWEKYVCGNAQKASRGDFLTLIAGPSRPGSLEAWKEDPNLEAITPDRLRDKIACEWSCRSEPSFPRRTRNAESRARPIQASLMS